ncbi:MAG: hypothetical protein ACLFUG_12525 [Nitriliruptoraceae bacterium]
MGALVLGLLQPLTPSVAAAADAAPDWAHQGEATSFVEDGGNRYILHRYDDPDASYPDFEVPGRTRPAALVARAVAATAVHPAG